MQDEIEAKCEALSHVQVAREFSSSGLFIVQLLRIQRHKLHLQ